ncbi:MAG TPA: glycosyltransferase family protein [Vicinamibacteria bacterium]|nr:glycosyltransferase family protein [Vicinamibacteria bacterium]
MRILYGVVGEGMGHATRSAVVLDHLAASGHEIKVVVSGKAHEFLQERFASRSNVALEEIEGLALRYFGNRLQRARSLVWNLKNAPKAVKKNVEVYRRVAEANFRPQMVVSDFESFAALYALRHGLPVVSIDNIQAVNRLKHGKAIRKGFEFEVARVAVKMKVPRAYHYLISSFFYPKVRKKFTTLVPPILRKEVVEAVRAPADHVVVYQRVIPEKEIVPMLRKLPFEFRVYGAMKEDTAGNVRLRRFSGPGFLEDLRTARAVIAGGGFSLMSEAVSLRVPMLAVPIEKQYEQELNARYLKELGYGSWTRELDAGAITRFLERTGEIQKSLASYERTDNRILLACLDELIARVKAGEKRPKRLETKAMGSYGD